MTKRIHETPTCKSYAARWIFPVEAAPIENGTIQIENGRIRAVHAGRDGGALDLGNVALIPGLVNAHTHLEFSELAGPVQPAAPFAQWIRAVIAYRQERSTPHVEAVCQGYNEIGRSGTTLIGEIATAGWSPHVFVPPGPRVVVFRELIGLRDEQIPEQLDLARQHLQGAVRNVAVSEGATAVDDGHVLHGLSPHAPYTVHPELFRALVDLAAEYHVPVTMHLAESRAELDLLSSGKGEIVELLRGFGLWSNGIIPRGSTPLDYLRLLAKLDRALVVHGNYLSEAEIDFLARHPNLTVVYCPRTHAYFGHAKHPWRRMLERGVSVALGTDSRASNPDLSLWRELLFLRERHREIAPETLLELGTLCGARALGVGQNSGSLTPGKSADLAIVQIASYVTGDPYTQLFHPDNRLMSAAGVKP